MAKYKTDLINLSNYTLISYNSIREEVTLLLDMDASYFTKGDKYYMKKSDHLLQRHVRNYYLRLEPVYFYFKKVTPEDPRHWKVRKSRQWYSTSIYGVFRITKRRTRLDKLENNSKMSNFNSVVADDDYFSAIPEVNDIAHWDNGIVYAGNVRLWTDAMRVESTVKNKWYSESLDNWDKFTISHDNLYNGEDLLNMIDKIGHEVL